MTEEEYGWHRQLAHARRDAFVRGVRYIEEFRRLGVWTGAETYATAIYPLPERPKPDPLTCEHTRVTLSRCIIPRSDNHDTVYCPDCGIVIKLPPYTRGA